MVSGASEVYCGFGPLKGHFWLYITILGFCVGARRAESNILLKVLDYVPSFSKVRRSLGLIRYSDSERTANALSLCLVYGTNSIISLKRKRKRANSSNYESTNEKGLNYSNERAKDYSK